MNTVLGYLAGIGTSIAWSFSTILITLVGERVGMMIVNRTRLLFAIGFAAFLHLALDGTLLPAGAGLDRWAWLSLSGTIGLALGDAILLESYLLIGPRIAMLILSLSPVFSVLIGFLFFGENLTALELGGIALTITGIALVVAEKKPGDDASFKESFNWKGLLFALGGSICQAVGLMFSRYGMHSDFSPLSANLIRLIASAAVLWLIAFWRGDAKRNFPALLEDKKVFGLMLLTALIGPFIGMWFSLVAVQNAPLGIASTLTSLAPILLLPLTRIFFGDKFGLQAVVGTVVAFAGTAMLFL